jgi:hypothetical protein
MAILVPGYHSLAGLGNLGFAQKVSMEQRMETRTQIS